MRVLLLEHELNKNVNCTTHVREERHHMSTNYDNLSNALRVGLSNILFGSNNVNNNQASCKPLVDNQVFKQVDRLLLPWSSLGGLKEYTTEGVVLMTSFLRIDPTNFMQGFMLNFQAYGTMTCFWVTLERCPLQYLNYQDSGYYFSIKNPFNFEFCQLISCFVVTLYEEVSTIEIFFTWFLSISNWKYYLQVEINTIWHLEWASILWCFFTKTPKDQHRLEARFMERASMDLLFFPLSTQ